LKYCQKISEAIRERDTSKIRERTMAAHIADIEKEFAMIFYRSRTKAQKEKGGGGWPSFAKKRKF
jgi:hypothetical protein